jgi:hypothetical protein
MQMKNYYVWVDGSMADIVKGINLIDALFVAQTKWEGYEVSVQEIEEL